MLFLLLAMQDVPTTAVEAEQTMERAAQAEGQWTAVRRFAAPDAVVLGPRPMSPAEAYEGQDSGPAYHWWVSDSFVSCDGDTAVNTGPWERDGRHGWFTTVWQRQADGWKWIVDSGDALAKPRIRPTRPKIHKASCRNTPENGFDGIPLGPRVTIDGLGESSDRTLIWEWHITPEGRWTTMAHLWVGDRHEPMLLDDSKYPQ